MRAEQDVASLILRRNATPERFDVNGKGGHVQHYFEINIFEINFIAPPVWLK
jgi:hypothetical protein